MNPERKSRGFKNIRIRVDGATVYKINVLTRLDRRCMVRLQSSISSVKSCINIIFRVVILR